MRGDVTNSVRASTYGGLCASVTTSVRGSWSSSAKLRAAGYGQPKITDASHLIVIARRTDVRAHIADELIARTAKISGTEASTLGGLKQAVDGAISMRDDAALDAWARAQTYIALGVMVETASLLGIDNGPMEGFNPAEVDTILGLEAQNLTATTMLALGYRDESDHALTRPKVRRDFEEAVTFVR